MHKCMISVWYSLIYPENVHASTLGDRTRDEGRSCRWQDRYARGGSSEAGPQPPPGGGKWWDPDARRLAGTKVGAVRLPTSAPFPREGVLHASTGR